VADTDPATAGLTVDDIRGMKRLRRVAGLLSVLHGAGCGRDKAGNRALHGVNWPMASVMLHFAGREPYPVLDFRALWSLNVPKPSFYTFDLWWAYTHAQAMEMAHKASPVIGQISIGIDPKETADQIIQKLRSPLMAKIEHAKTQMEGMAFQMRVEDSMR
jgi:hypothetical protein